jgi:hypothetical protein
MARLRYPDGLWKCLLIGEDRKWWAQSQEGAFDPTRTFPRSNSAKIVRDCWIVFGAAWNWVALCGNSPCPVNIAFRVKCDGELVPSGL